MGLHIKWFKSGNSGSRRL